MAQADPIAARELALWAVNTGDLYRQRAQPIMRNLAAKIAKGTYEPGLALKTWGYLADDAANSYAKQFGSSGQTGAAMFNKATRQAAAVEIAEHYADQIAELVVEIQNRNRWSLSAIRAAHEKAGFHFFSRDTMRHFGDTMRDFQVVCEGSRVWVERRRGGDVRWLFDPNTGALTPISSRA